MGIATGTESQPFLRWQRMLMKHFRIFRTFGKKKGQKPINKELHRWEASRGEDDAD